MLTLKQMINFYRICGYAQKEAEQKAREYLKLQNKFYGENHD